ncbi:MAG: prepilin-type N-terminal cleavage/methylation domain-containing protein [Gemmatimonadota bacterium]|jgi:prepilin-type N-terminal cleavage/methylation domain-containing protein
MTALAKPRPGFTLVEVLVGMTVAALALGAAFAALSFVGDRSREAEFSATTALEGAVAREMLVDWLSGALFRASNRAGEFQGLDADENGLENDELYLPTTAMTPLHASTTVVRLFIDEADSTAERGLVAELTERVQDEPMRVELVPQAARMDLAFLPNVPDAEEWLPSWVGQGGLPRAVELLLSAAPGDSLPPLLRLPIRVALGTVR